MIFLSITASHNEQYSSGVEKNKIEGGVLYLVATPIGNLSDLSARAEKVLSGVDFIAAEDTRNTGKLLNYIGVKKPQISYFEHNIRERGEYICSRLSSGESCALVTDAGTPAVSDPGEDIVSLCIEKGIRVTSVPGACAAVNALILSGLPTGRFCFEGFLSTNKNERNRRLTSLAAEERTMIIYEAPHKLIGTLNDLLSAFGNRRIALCREMTKLNEDITHTDIEGAVSYYANHAPRGEYVLIIGGAQGETAKFWDNMTVGEHVQYYQEHFSMRKMDAVKAAAHDRSVAKNEVYREVFGNDK